MYYIKADDWEYACVYKKRPWWFFDKKITSFLTIEEAKEFINKLNFYELCLQKALKREDTTVILSPETYNDLVTENKLLKAKLKKYEEVN